MDTPSASSQIRKATSAYVSQIQSRYLSQDGYAKALLANLRQCTGKPLGQSPDSWEAILAITPENLVGRSTQPSRAEHAIFTAMTLFAHHIQSKSQPMHVPIYDKDGNKHHTGLGDAVRKIANPTDTDEFNQGIMRRFRGLITASTQESRVHNLRGLVELLRSSDVALDYGQLAVDLFQLESHDLAPSVHLRWGRQLYRSSSKKSTPSS